VAQDATTNGDDDLHSLASTPADWERPVWMLDAGDLATGRVRT
jgi:hypothetical protein